MSITYSFYLKGVQERRVQGSLRDHPQRNRGIYSFTTKKAFFFIVIQKIRDSI